MNKITSVAPAVRFVDISEKQAGQRIDNFLLKTLKTLPKSRLYRIIRKGEVRVNKKRVKPDYKLIPGDRLRIPPVRLDGHDEGPVVLADSLLKQLDRAILYENDHILVLNKPSGLAVHSGSGLRFGVIDVMRRLRHQHDIELVHRLDRDTSGCLLLAKNRASLLAMQKLLQSSVMQKRYLAVVKGHWDKSQKRIDLPLLRQTMPNGEKRVFVDERGQQAITGIDQVRHLSSQGIHYSLLKIRLLTGRTHQIRAHCQSQQHEISGDVKYGDRQFNRKMKGLGCKRLLLHAVELEIPKNDYTKALKIIAPVSGEFIKTGFRQNESEEI